MWCEICFWERVTEREAEAWYVVGGRAWQRWACFSLLSDSLGQPEQYPRVRMGEYNSAR